MDVGLRGSVALVTGGAKGVGAGISRALTELGATVVACGRRAPESGPAGVEFAECDVRDAEQVHALIEGVCARHGRLDVLVNNAGGSPPVDAATANPRLHAKVV